MLHWWLTRSDHMLIAAWLRVLQRMERLAASAGGGSIVTTKSWADMDDDNEALQRLNIILKVSIPLLPSCEPVPTPNRLRSLQCWSAAHSSCRGGALN